MKRELESPPVVTASTTTFLTEPNLFCCHRELGPNHDPPNPTLYSLAQFKFEAAFTDVRWGLVGCCGPALF